MRERLPLYTSLLLVLVTLVAYLPVTGHDFVRFDDPLYVTRNPQVQAGLTANGLTWALAANVASNWHPLTLVSHMLDCQLYGMNPRGHHLTSLLLHLANTVLLFEVLRRMTGSTWRSAVVAALFGLHPTHVESVAWVAERKDVLSGLFWILTMGAWHRYVQGPSRGRYLTVMLCLALGLMSKPMVVTLPFVLVLLDVWPLKRGIHIKEKLPLFALSAASAVVTVVAQSHSLASTDAFPVWHRISNAVLSYVRYLWITIAPHDLAVFYPMALSFSAWKVALAALLLAALTALAFLAVRRAPWATVGWLWFLGTLVPVIGLVQVGGQAMADRYTYLPTIGLFLIVAWSLPERKTSMVAVAAAVLALAVGTRLQLRHWVDSEALFRHAATVTERNYLAHLNLAQILAEQNRQAESLEQFRQAFAIRPGMWQIHASRGNSLRRWGRPAEALPSLRRAIALRPNDGKLHHSLAMALDDLGQTDEAIAELRKAVELSPGLDDAWYGLGLLLRRKGDAAGALQNFQAAPESVRARLGGRP
ncbi:MAG: tetratricopeptide repeat protein [Acidobacteriota bacterium]